MTKYFEVIHRDGSARLGKIRFPTPLPTPAICDDFLYNSGSLWATEKEIPSSLPTDKLLILPHRGFPPGTGSILEDAFFVKPPDLDHPTATVISPKTASDLHTDAYILSTAPYSTASPLKFCNDIIQTKTSIPSDSALYLPGIVTPQNLSFFIYLGIDLFDTTRAVLSGLQGTYLLPTGEYPLESLNELPCHCPACSIPIDTFTNENCATHNVNALQNELSLVTEYVRSNRLRDYLEGQVRHSTWLTAAFRYLDSHPYYLEQRTPIARKEGFIATTDDSLNRIEIIRFQDRILQRYTNRFKYPLVLVPCSAKKPYSKSKSHRFFHQSIHFRGHKVSISSPLGIVPQELELTYPAQHYDTAVTGNWSSNEIKRISNLLSQYLESNSYPKIIAHIPSGGYQEIVELATEHSSIPIEYTVKDHPLSPESLQNLDKALSLESPYSRRERMLYQAQAIADYQFGNGAGDLLFNNCTLKGKYFARRIFDTDQIATLLPEYGLFSLTLHGANKLKNSKFNTAVVTIDNFVPQGSVLAPGVVSASETIRPGDEVLVQGPLAFAVGRAIMSGPEMQQSSRGVAIDIRHVQKL
jgi:archaeosine synthase